MVINGSLTAKGTLSANILLFQEVVSSENMTRGANVNLVNGRFYYKIDENNIFEFYNSSEISGGGGETIITNVGNYAIQESEIIELLNTTFFCLNDNSSSFLVNMNFDVSTSLTKASYAIDKVSTLLYKNNYLNKFENQTYPSLSISSYQNTDVLDTFLSVKFDNTSISSIEQSIINNNYFTNIAEQSTIDISTVLDYLLVDNINDNTIVFDASSILYNGIFSLNWINYKLELLNYKNLISSISEKIFNNESLQYFFDNYVSFYKDSTQSRVRVYFFDYKTLIHFNTFHIVNYIKSVYENTNDYTNELADSINNYKLDHTDLTSQDKDYTSMEYLFETNEIIEHIFESNTTFSDKIDWSSLNVVINCYQQNLVSLNDSTYNELDLSNSQPFTFVGESQFKPVINRLNIASGEFQVPLIEVDFPLDSYFYFMM